MVTPLLWFICPNTDVNNKRTLEEIFWRTEKKRLYILYVNEILQAQLGVATVAQWGTSAAYSNTVDLFQ